MGEIVRRVGSVLALVVLLSLSACDFSTPSADVTITNDTGQRIRVTGNCVVDDPHDLAPGVTDSMLFLGADCRIDNGDGLDGVLGCITLTETHTDLTLADLRPISGADDCWGGGTR
jgi:hypothetical protein